MLIGIVNNILPILLMIALGAAIKTGGYLPPPVMAGMKKLAVNITLPVIIFCSLLDLKVSVGYLLAPFFVFVALTLLFGAGFLLKRIFKSQNPYFPTLFTSFENGMIGYGALAAALGSENIFAIVLMDLGQTVFFALVFVTVMRRLNGERALSAKLLVLSFVKNPYVWASVCALSLNGAGLSSFLHTTPPITAVLSFLTMLGGLTTPMMCLVIGSEIRIEPRNIIRPIIVSLCRLALLLCAAFLLDAILTPILRPDTVFRISLYAMFLLPPFFVGPALIKDTAVEEKAFSVNVISVHILLFLLLFPLVVAFMQRGV